MTTQFAFADPPPTKNPWNPARTPGGSSSGSAAAVAARMVPGALGSQTAGSVLRPAGYCGVVGLKPTFGRIPATGVLPDAWSLDHVGVITPAVEDAALLLEILAGHDPNDPTSARVPVELYAEQARRPVERLRLGVLPEFLDRAEPDVRAHLADLLQRGESAGAELCEVSLPTPFETVLAIHTVIMMVEMAAVHRQQLTRYPDHYAPRLRAYVEAGQLIDGASYVHTQRLRRRFHAGLPALFRDADILVCPTASNVAPDPGTTGDRRFQAIWTLAGLPALSVPTGLNHDGLPFSTQLIAPPFAEGKLLQAGRWLEQVAGRMSPPSLP